MKVYYAGGGAKCPADKPTSFETYSGHETDKSVARKNMSGA